MPRAALGARLTLLRGLRIRLNRRKSLLDSLRGRVFTPP
jgi:hypothetical protein